MGAPRSADWVLYLDLDGVVQSEEVYFHPRRGPFVHQGYAPGRKLFEWVPILESIIELHPQLKLVLSSTWCIRPGYGKTLKRLPASLRQRFIGGTFHRRIHGEDHWTLHQFRSMPRGMQVWADVVRRAPKQWVALDDDTLHWPAWARDNLVACDGQMGLSDLKTQELLRQKLKEQARALNLEPSI